ncbi:MAG TPA: murein biosynthesis integral membrane protein MurJ [Phycisphaerae bacterium]|nr:murein biosynthesis integral membrane protein MurJ [Phycisphaerae bacterium]HNU46083.1 murein biosynthesis integral membrane protein MurJ [Phycisphaerae bacterium]
MSLTGRLVASTRLIAVLTLGSRVAGMAREWVFSYFFGTSELLSAFSIAYLVSNLARRLFGEGALSSATIPVLTESLHTRGEQASRQLLGSVLTLLVVFLSAATVVGELVLAGWRTVQSDPALDFTAIMLPFMVPICAVAVAGGALNVRNHFATPAALPVALNLTIIAGALLAALGLGWRDRPLMVAICVTVLVAGLLQVLLIAWALRANGFFPIFGGPWRDPLVRSVFTLMAPMVLGLSAVQINTCADSLIAYLFVSVNGERIGPSVLRFAQYLYQLPLGVLGIALATAIFPTLSARSTSGDRAGLADVLGRGMRLSLFLAFPAGAGLFLVAHPLVATLFERGEFTGADTHRVAAVLQCYSLGMPAYFALHVLVRTFYAEHDSRTPARTALGLVLVNLTLNVVLVFPLQERGLALSTAVCAVVQAGWLARKLSQRLPEVDRLGVGRSVLRTVAATGAMVVVVAAADWLPVLQPLLRIHAGVRLVVLMGAGAMTFALAAWGLRLEELRDLLRRGR